MDNLLSSFHHLESKNRNKLFICTGAPCEGHANLISLMSSIYGIHYISIADQVKHILTSPNTSHTFPNDEVVKER